MTDLTELLINVGLVSAMLALTMTAMVITAVMPSEDRWNRRFFISLFAANTLCMVSFLIDSLTWQKPGMATAAQVSIYFECLFVTLPMPMFTAYLLHTCDAHGGAGASTGERWQQSWMFRAAIAIWSVFFILLGIAQCTTFIYYITPENHFVYGPYHFLLMTPMNMLMFLNLAGVICRRSSLPPKYYIAFLSYLLPMTAAILIHTFFFDTLVSFIGEIASAFSMFAIILYDKIEQYMRQQRKIAQQRASIMVLQMRPHFIYNAMMSIYYLCAQDAKKAQQVTLDFTTYLRKNFTAIASEDMVPFSDELEHTRAYLAVEQVQFEDSLLVDYNTPHKDFRVPPLTLQPIVENAVKHGMDPEYAPLHLSIRTRATEAGSEIIVEDNGPGFATPSDNSHPHVALENIRQRLSMMCDGKMTIHSREGGGTTVTVIVNDRIAGAHGRQK